MSPPRGAVWWWYMSSPKRRSRNGPEQGEGGSMKRRSIAVSESFTQWRKDPAFRKAYNALDEEFALASAMIRARAEANMTQDQVARAMGTTQAVIARLEGGQVKPSTRTLE